MARWRQIKIGDVCVVERGGSPRPIDKFITEDENGINWIKIGDTTESMYITKTAQKIIPEGAKKSRFVQSGDFLLSNSMSFGRPYILNIDGCIHDGWLVLRDECNLFDKHFLYYCLSAPVTYAKFKSMAVGGVVNNLNSEMVRNVEIPLPPLEEQRKIAAVLDKISDLIAKRRTQLDKLDELVKSRFIEMFGDVTKNEKNWSTRKISEIATLQSGGTPSRQCPKYFEGTIPWITTVALGKNAIGIEDAIEYITEEAIENSATKLIPKNSLLFGIRVGVGKVSENIVPMCINQDIVAIIINDRYKLNMLFLKNLLDMFSGYFNSQKRGATIQGIKSEVLKNISVSLPPLELQNQFADFVKQTDKSKLAIQKNLEKLEILKKSLMQKYFD